MWAAIKSDFKEFVTETAKETKAVVITVPISRSVMIGGVVAPHLTTLLLHGSIDASVPRSHHHVAITDQHENSTTSVCLVRTISW
eukprot:scaffold7232_cov63-Cyclotella_meneghiniana.AAC.5